MKPVIRIIKRKQDDDENELGRTEVRKIVKPGSREIAKTIEGWKSDFLHRKRVERYSFSGLRPFLD